MIRRLHRSTFSAYIRLTRARFAAIAKDEGGWVDVDAKAELDRAAKLIRELRYGRRYEELADAEEEAKHWTA